MFRLYGDDLEAMRLYGLEGAGLGALGGSSMDYMEKAVSPFFSTPDWLELAAAAEVAEKLLTAAGRTPTVTRFKWSTLLPFRVLQDAAKGATAYFAQLEKDVAALEAADAARGLGFVTAAITVGVSAYGALKGLHAGRKAAQSARKKARGARGASDAVTAISWRGAETLMELARLGIDPPDRPDETWRTGWEQRLNALGGLFQDKKQRHAYVAAGAIQWFKTIAAALKTLPATPQELTLPTLPVGTRPSTAGAPLAVQVAPGSPAVTVAAPAAAPVAAPAAGGMGKLGLALLAAKLLLG